MPDIFEMCRLCGSESGDMREIFYMGTTIADDIRTVTKIDIHQEDRLPSGICPLCRIRLKSAKNFIKNCIKYNENLELLCKKQTTIWADLEESRAWRNVTKPATEDPNGSCCHKQATISTVLVESPVPLVIAKPEDEELWDLSCLQMQTTISIAREESHAWSKVDEPQSEDLSCSNLKNESVEDKGVPVQETVLDDNMEEAESIMNQILETTNEYCLKAELKEESALIDETDANDICGAETIEADAADLEIKTDSAAAEDERAEVTEQLSNRSQVAKDNLDVSKAPQHTNQEASSPETTTDVPTPNREKVVTHEATTNRDTDVCRAESVNAMYKMGTVFRTPQPKMGNLRPISHSGLAGAKSFESSAETANHGLKAMVHSSDPATRRSARLQGARQPGRVQGVCQKAIVGGKGQNGEKKNQGKKGQRIQESEEQESQKNGKGEGKGSLLNRLRRIRRKKRQKMIKGLKKWREGHKNDTKNEESREYGHQGGIRACSKGRDAYQPITEQLSVNANQLRRGLSSDHAHHQMTRLSSDHAHQPMTGLSSNYAHQPMAQGCELRLAKAVVLCERLQEDPSQWHCQPERKEKQDLVRKEGKAGSGGQHKRKIAQSEGKRDGPLRENLRPQLAPGKVRRNVEEKNPAKRNVEEKKHRYVRCSSSSDISGHLKDHMLTHTGKKAFSCPHCVYKSTENGTLQRHLRTHTGDKPFACTHCDYKAAEKGSLAKHMLTHTGDKPFQCTECEYAASYRSNLQRHVRAKHSKEHPYACTECEYTCVESGNLTRHMLTHTGVKKFACHECEYTCNRRDTLTSHMTTHTGVKKLTCQECAYGCNRPDELKKHQTAKHAAEASQ